MASSMLEALKNAKLVDAKRAKEVEAAKRRYQKLDSDSKTSGAILEGLARGDAEQAEKEEKYLAHAGKQYTKRGSQVGTKQYFDRFKK